MSSSLPELRIYCDGGCRPNPGPGGWGAVLLAAGHPRRELSGGEPATTNNRMELTAAIEALNALDVPHQVEVVTDSEYLRRGITEWLPRWKAKGWRTADNAPVQNQDLWQELEAGLARHRVAWRWTKGHAGDRHNERADRLAAAAIPRPALPLDDTNAVHLFVAVAHSGRSRTGGWAALLRFREHERTLSGKVASTTANRMHLESAVGGLEALTKPSQVHLYTASDYLKDGASSWLRAWKARGWRTREGAPVSHRDLWQRLDRQLARHRVEWHVVPSDDPPEPLAIARQLAREALSGGEEAENGQS